MKKHAVKFSFFVSLLLLSAVGAAQTNSQNELSRGVVIEKVACQTDVAQNYALYLPTGYTPEKKWAILYAFDPFGNGKAPVEIFRDAAEKYGFIVVGSNNSQNNLSGEKLTEIITAFWKDSHARFSIDERRAYAVGLSGGARVANYFAASCRGCIAGVIACGATFTPDFPLDKSLPFSIFGTVGVDDFNYPELIDVFVKLNKSGAANWLDVFEGTHQWLPKDLAGEALEWMNLQAMKAGRMETDKKFVEDLLAKQMSKAQTLFQNGDVLQAARVYENIVNNFKDISDVKSAGEKLAEINQGKSYKKALAEEKSLIDEQQRTAKKIISMGADLLDANSKNATLQRAAAELESWRQKSKAAGDSGERRLARRILDQVFVATYEVALYVNERQRDYKTMIANLEITSRVNPQNSRALFALARAFALDGQKKNAVETLALAVKNGFSDCARIIDKAEWTNLRDDKQFQKITGQLKCSNKGI